MLSPGHVVAGRYELVELLGEGGHGAVYRALQKPLGREVAIKMILAEAMLSEGMLERFTREAALVQRLEHPNTVRIYDFGSSEEGLPFIVFELLRGRTLEQEIARGTLTTSRVARVASQVLKSLMEAHALGIVHRDIKPSNILLSDYSGEIDFVKVLDFGVARHNEPGAGGAPITRAGQIVGTPSYMAPEQIHGRAIGPEADLYSLGLVMAEAASGARVYDGGTAMEIWMRQTSAEPVPLPPIAVSSALGPVIARATRKVASERYPSAEAMLADVERALLAGGGETDPLAKPLVVHELQRITARLTRDRPAAPGAPLAGPPQTPFAMSPPTPHAGPSPHTPSAPPPYMHTPQAPWGARPSWPSPSSSSQTPSIPASQPTPPSPSTGSSAAIVILGVIAILSLLLAAGAGGALYLSRRQAAATPTAVPPFVTVTRGKLAAVTPDRTEKRLRQAGWEISPVPPIAPSPGFKGTFFGIARGAHGGQVMLYEYDSESLATAVEKSMRANTAAVIERDGGRILLVVVAQDPAESRKLFDELVR
jgi:serine/threonine-protein kinase